MQRICHRADRRRVRCAGVPCRKNDQALRALCDGNPDRRIRGDRAVGQIKILVTNRRKGAGDRGRGYNRFGREPSDNTTLSPEIISVVTM